MRLALIWLIISPGGVMGGRIDGEQVETEEMLVDCPKIPRIPAMFQLPPGKAPTEIPTHGFRVEPPEPVPYIALEENLYSKCLKDTYEREKDIYAANENCQYLVAKPIKFVMGGQTWTREGDCYVLQDAG